MSDRYLRQLLRDVRSGDIPLTDYFVVALRVMSLEDTLETLQGFDTNNVRHVVKMFWIPVYAAQSKENRNRVALAGVLGDAVSKRVAPSRKKNDFPEPSFYQRNVGQLTDREWRLFAADCAEHVLHYFESVYPNDNRPRVVIETTRRAVLGQATVEELVAAASAARSSVNTTWSAARLAARLASRSAAGLATGSSWLAAYDVSRFAIGSAAVTTGESAEHQWQRNRLIDYLTGLSALPPSAT